ELAAEQAAREKAARDKAQQVAQQQAELKAEREAQAQKKREADAQKKRAAEEARQREAAASAAATKAEQARLEQLRKDQMSRMFGSLSGNGAPGSKGTAARTSGPRSSAGYAARLRAVIKPNIVFPDTLPGNPVAVVEVSATSTGTIIARRLVKSSGFKEWDDAVLRAIDRTATLPRDTDGSVPSPIQIEFRPNE
ncbi:MAG: cell envelope integrity protein TolA, partial [Burkholderiales bacterium]|nr:cell envelope integrity protein TolA [Burkholderiales bacterium]